MSRRGDDSTWRPGTPIGAAGRPAATREELIDNPAATRVVRAAGLVRRAARSRHGRFLVEGPQGVREAVRHAPDRVLDVYLTQAAAGRHPEIGQEAVSAGLYTHLVTPAVMSVMSQDGQGVLAVCATAGHRVGPVGAQDAGAVLAGARLVAVLAEAQDPGNAGTIIRTADAAGADAVLVLHGSVEVTNPKVVRATAGSLFHLPVVTGLGAQEASRALKEAGLRLLAADGSGQRSLFDADAQEALAAPTAWLLGNEARGLGDDLRRAADEVVSIPIYGSAESLNVATAAAVCLYASARAQR